jgi:hypothetical protein
MKLPMKICKNQLVTIVARLNSNDFLNFMTKISDVDVWPKN